MTNAHNQTDPAQTETGEAKRDEDAFPFGAPGSYVRWPRIMEHTQRGGSHFFDDSTMRYFQSRTNGDPRVGPDGHIYGVVSSRPRLPRGAARYYDVIRVDKETGAVGRAHHPDAPHDPDRRPLRFSDRARAVKAMKQTAGVSDRGDLAAPAAFYRWY